MSELYDVACPGCEKRFVPEDDIVTCPVCGTPQHRSCYLKRNECVNEYRHASGFVWKIEDATLFPEQAFVPGSPLYPDSGEADGADVPGTLPQVPASKEEFLRAFKAYAENSEYSQYNRKYTDDEVKELIKRADEIKREAERPEIFGVSEREIYTFQGGMSNPFLIQRYRNMAKSGRKASFNLFAGLLAPYYQFLNRMRGLGAVLASLFFFRNFPTIVMSLKAYGGISIAENSVFQNDNALLELSNAFTLFGALMTIFIAVFYDYFYLKWMTNKIKSIRTAFLAAADRRPQTGSGNSVSEAAEKAIAQIFPEEVNFQEANFVDSFPNDFQKELSDDYYAVLYSAGRPSFGIMILDGVTAGILSLILALLIMAAV
ncbi:hypothetical protein FACS189499_09160 [Clostridia bacterium]|nr:hypothetical protein FACS189499_09160 [Clostridia bacterium]